MDSGDAALAQLLGGEVPRLGPLDWKAEGTRRGLDFARRLLDRHADELRSGLDRDTAAFVCTTTIEGVMNAAVRQAAGRPARRSLLSANACVLPHQGKRGRMACPTPSRGPNLSRP